jgi:hypothetical protein
MIFLTVKTIVLNTYMDMQQLLRDVASYISK